MYDFWVKNLLIIAQKVDAEDDLLGFFVDWLKEFSKHFEVLHVITLGQGKHDLPSNVHIHSLGKERHVSKVIRALRFYVLLFRLMPRVDGVFAHMSPIFAIAAWPVAFLYRRKIILWYLHRSVTLRLRVAEKLCHKVVTAAKESLNLKSSKVIEIGHGIDVKKFETLRDRTSDELNILMVGRISPIKNQDILLRAAKILKERGFAIRITIVGKPIMPADLRYERELEHLYGELELRDTVSFAGSIPYDRIRDLYKRADVVVGLTPHGGVDKTILEGMAAGCITLTSNDVCKRYFSRYGDLLTVEYRDPESLAMAIERIMDLSADEKIKIGQSLVSEVKAHHDIENMARRIADLY